MWWVNPANKSIYICNDSRKAREIRWTTAILRKPVKSLLSCKLFCTLSGLHISCFSLLFLAPICTEPGFISVPVLSHPAVPAALPSACSPPYPMVSHPAPLCILISASILVLHLKLHLLSYSPLTAFYFTTCGSSLLPHPYHFPIWRSPPTPFPITRSILVISLHLLSFLCPVPVLALVSAPITFSEDLKPTHLCVNAEAVCLSLFYSIIHFSF